MGDRNDGPDDSLKHLGQRLDEVRSRQGGRRRPSAVDRGGEGMAVGFRIAVELTAALVVGGFIGYMADLWLGTAPLFLIVMLLFGAAAGFLQVYRTAMELERKAKAAKQAAQQRRDADERSNG